MELITNLAKLNEFKVGKNFAKQTNSRVWTLKKQKELAETIVAELGENSIYIEHVNYINFTRFDLPQPTYINLVRDPVERVISWFYYQRGAYKNAILFKNFPESNIQPVSWFKKDFNHCVRSGDPECQYVPFSVNDHSGDYRRQSLFFCGHTPDCIPFNSPTAIQIAKSNVERYYAVVGSWEDTNITLTVFEEYIPKFFKGASFLFDLHKDELINRNKNKRKPKIYDDVREMLRKNFTYEYDFYWFCKQRLYKQYAAIRLLNNLRLQSLSADRLNNTKNSNPNIVFFNRAAKVGSEAMMELILILKRFNEFEFQIDHASETRLRSSALQAKTEEISQLADETIFMEHISFINFTQFGFSQPIYINLVRDPVERVISWFFYIRGAYKNAILFRRKPNTEIKSMEWWKKDFNKCVRSGDPECVFEQYSITDNTGDFRRQSMFFCGHSRDCLPFNSPSAIQIAKQNVEKYYAVVGSWEDTNVTLAVLEKFIPRYFHGAQLMFEIHKDKIRARNRNNRKPKIDNDVKEMIKKNFTQEYEFYHFCKQRLYKQYISIKLKELDSDQWRK